MYMDFFAGTRSVFAHLQGKGVALSGAFILASVWVMPIPAEGQIQNLREGMQSPEAASLGEYGDVPVSYYTGTPQIEIPLATIQATGVEIPVKLTYHASGIKVNEVASWVGLGWSLRAGGTITRTVRGRPDEVGGGYWVNGYRFYEEGHWPFPEWSVGGGDTTGVWNAGKGLMAVPQNFSNQSSEFRHTLFHDLIKGSVDTAPDLYSYTFADRSGQFARGPVNTRADGIVTSAYSNLRIERRDGSENGWVITTENGTRYVFGRPETTIEKMETTGGPEFTGSTNRSYTSAWNLEKVVSPTGDEITFSYDEITIETYRDIVSQSESSGCLPSSNTTDRESTLRIPYLARIDSKDTVVEFVRSSNRDDQPFVTSLPPSERPLLDEVIVTEKTGGTKKRIDLSYRYFGEGSADADLRLKLTGVEETTPDGDSTGPSYAFEYVGSRDGDPNLPAYGSFARDHWGYYSGADGNLSLLPETSEDVNWTEPTADRSPDPTVVSAGMIRRIQYATGGSTTFHWEADHYSATASGYPPGSGIGGGVRIRKMVDRDGTGTEMVRRFDYTKAGTSMSSGVLIAKPTYAYSTRLPGTSNCTQQKRSSSSMVPVGATGGPVVGYGRVSEIHGQNGQGGRNIYEYRSSADAPDVSLITTSTARQWARTRLDWMRGMQTGSETKGVDDSLIRRVDRTHDFRPAVDARELSVLNSDQAISTIEDSTWTQSVPVGKSLRAIKLTYLGAVRSSIFTLDPVAFYRVVPYYVFSGWSPPVREKVTTYDPEGQRSAWTETVRRYSKSGASTGQLRSRTKQTSNGRSRTSHYWYAHERYPNMGRNGTHQLGQKYQISILDGEGTVLRRNWQLWMLNEDGHWVQDEVLEWTGE